MPNCAGEQFGKQRLRSVIRAAMEGSAEQIAQAIRDALAEFRGTAKPVDDVTFIVVKTIVSAAGTHSERRDTLAIPFAGEA